MYMFLWKVEFKITVFNILVYLSLLHNFDVLSLSEWADQTQPQFVVAQQLFLHQTIQFQIGFHPISLII